LTGGTQNISTSAPSKRARARESGRSAATATTTPANSGVSIAEGVNRNLSIPFEDLILSNVDRMLLADFANRACESEVLNEPVKSPANTGD
jgi:hypothetical protein